MYWGPMLIGLVFMAISLIVSSVLKSKFTKYSKTRLMNGMTGKEIAEKMLADNGIHDVQVIQVNGQLTDHYNPMKKTVNLSEAVYHQANAAAAAVAAHEVGHAVQHANAYKPLEFRSKLVPVQNASGMIMNIIVMAAIFGGYALYSIFPMDTVIWIIIAAQSVITLFTLITLPVEFDASKRALAWIDQNGVVTHSEHAMAKDALKWAAMTYVVAALGAIANLLFWVMMLLGRE
ncbi:MAG: zinc metallopeptidase [Crocinitomicaceae bacterium]|nr:zinc metallopeptidase [Crocinitomicaceae bacterium]